MAKPILVVMGVSGCGKSTIGAELGKKLGWRFLEGDAFHPPSNIRKMTGGIPLTDEDRWPWLDAIGQALKEAREKNIDTVLACSALRKTYRSHLASHCPGLLFIYLKGEKNRIGERLGRRKGHYMPPSLLQSQFDTLEEPSKDENVLSVDTSQEPDILVGDILKRLEPYLTSQVGLFRG